MAVNFPGPGIAEFYYVVAGLEHKQTVSVALSGTPPAGSDASDVTLIQTDAGTRSFDVWAEEYGGKMRAFLHTAVDIVRVDLWYSDQTSYDRIFITSHDLALSGTVAGAPQLANQITLTFRTAEGGTARISFLDPSLAIAYGRYGYPVATTAINDMNALFTGSDSCILGRDTSRIIGRIAYLSGQNEAVFKRRFRP